MVFPRSALVLIALSACHGKSSSGDAVASASAPAAAASATPLPSGLFCARESPSSCYDIDAKTLKVTLVLKGHRGGVYQLVPRDDGSYSFMLSADNTVQVRVKGNDTLTVGSGPKMATLERREPGEEPGHEEHGGDSDDGDD